MWIVLVLLFLLLCSMLTIEIYSKFGAAGECAAHELWYVSYVNNYYTHEFNKNKFNVYIFARKFYDRYILIFYYDGKILIITRFAGGGQLITADGNKIAYLVGKMNLLKMDRVYFSSKMNKNMAIFRAKNWREGPHVFYIANVIILSLTELYALFNMDINMKSKENNATPHIFIVITTINMILLYF
ncbi:hypothetical protein IEQ34_023018 [Dendrobium chrysotoxum]|uniref:Uncharacterized protein n=1 Tax=Dendrobium chrysotoxum TaxID=161865 RepID=A0AAV7G0I9_DENCH|nr:hypothetical protein IEQ34_023018 [Dendrobium chrysotoxum]